MRKTNENLWADLQDRSSGEVIRKEDDVKLMDSRSFYDYLQKNYKDKVYDISQENFDTVHHIYVDVTKEIFVHIVYRTPKGGLQNIERILIGAPQTIQSEKIVSSLYRQFDVAPPRKSLYTREIAKKDDSELTNQTFLDIVDILLKKIKSNQKKPIKENLWADLQDRSSGEVVRKEDDVNLLDREGLYEYIKKKYESKVVWMQTAATTIVIEPIEKIYLSLNYRNNIPSFIVWGGKTDMPYVSKSFLKKLEERFKLRKNGNHEKRVKEKDGTINNQTFIDFVDMFMENKDNILNLNENLWADLQDRSSGEVTRKEDEIPESIKEALAAYIDIFVHGIDGADVYTVGSLPDFKAFIKDFANKPRISNIDFDMDELLDYVEDHSDYILDIIRKTIKAYDKQIDDMYDQIRSDLEKGEVNENLWADLQDRSSGEVVRKEDDVNLLGIDGFYDYLQKHYKCTSSFFDKSGNGVITVPLYIMDNHQGFSHLYISYYDEGLNINNVSDIRFRSLDYISKVLKEHNLKLAKFGPFTMVSPEDGGQLDNRFCLKVIDLIISTAKRPILKKIEGLDECDGVPGGLTPGDVGGMGAAYFPGPNGEPGSGDLPSPTGIVYQQVAPFGIFINMKKKKKRKKKFRKEDEPCAHSPNAKVYDYVDDFRDYVDRTYNIMDRR